MISQLETPTNTVQANEKFNYKHINMNNYNNRNLNAFNNFLDNQRKITKNNNNNDNINNSNNLVHNNNNTSNNFFQETEIIDYSEPAKKNAFDYNQMIENHYPLDSFKTTSNHEKIKYSTIQQKKKIKPHINNNFPVDEDFGEDYVRT